MGKNRIGNCSYFTQDFAGSLLIIWGKYLSLWLSLKSLKKMGQTLGDWGNSSDTVLTKWPVRPLTAAQATLKLGQFMCVCLSPYVFVCLILCG